MHYPQMIHFLAGFLVSGAAILGLIGPTAAETTGHPAPGLTDMASGTEAKGSALRLQMAQTSAGSSSAGVLAASSACKSITALPTDQQPVIVGGSNGVATPPDVVIDSCVTIPPGTYTYGHVNVTSGGALAFQDATGGTDFYAKSILIQQGGTVTAGTYDTPFGTHGGKLTIGLWGDDPTKEGTVTDPSDPGAYCKDSSGKAAPCYPANLTSSANYCSGTDLTSPCNSSTKPASGNNALFEGYGEANANLYLPFDKTTTGNSNPVTHGNFGYKVLAVSYGGSLQLFGAKGVKSADRTNPATKLASCPVPKSTDQFTPDKWAELSGGGWARLIATAASGASSLTLDRDVDWEPNDRIVLTTTDWQPGHSELLALSSAPTAPTAQTVTLGSATAHAHQGTIFSIKKSELSHDPGHQNMEADVRAAVGLLTRDITIRSMGATFDSTSNIPEAFPEASSCTWSETQKATKKVIPSCYFGGHVIARQGFGTFQVQGVEFYQLGQGGRMGHYPVHFHMAKDTSYTNAFVRDSSIWDSMNRFVVLHGTHGVELSRNVGYLSVGHAFFLEDASEIDNLLCYNLGVSARAPYEGYFKAQDTTNPGPTARVVPAILSGFDGADDRSPTLFWMMNTYNEFVGNMAVGAHGMGTCFWPLPSSVSGLSASSAVSWSNSQGDAPYRYANYNQAGTISAPLKRFRGNTCTTAAYAFMTDVDAVPFHYGTAVKSPYNTSGLSKPTLANNFMASVDPTPCSPATLNSSHAGKMAKTCATTILDHFTTSFNWAQVNFGSIWLRPWNYVLSNSAMTDQLYGGLGFVSGGSPEQANVQRLTIAYDSLFLGSTNPGSQSAGELGPDLSVLTCTTNPTPYCESAIDGTFYYLPEGLNPKRMMTIYDGPFFSQGSIFDTSPVVCDPWDTKPSNTMPCGIYRASAQPWQSSTDKNHKNGLMEIINAGIGWKQPNGFYYPPMFAFKNTAFKTTTERHNVLDQYKTYVYGVATPESTGVPVTADVFTAIGPSVTPIDATTILNDLDGTLNGLKPTSGSPRTSGLSNNHFFNAPFGVAQCNSFGTQTLPVDFVTTAITQLADQPSSSGSTTTTPWSVGGAQPAVPIYRQYKLPGTAESCSATAEICNGSAVGCQRGTFAMGAAVNTGFALTMRNGLYYIDTDTQPGGCAHVNSPFQVASYAAGDTYGVYHLYANDETKVTYQIYVGASFNVTENFQWIRVLPHKTGQTAYDVKGISAPSGIKPPTLSSKGVLTVELDNSKIAADFGYQSADTARCQPLDICAPDDKNAKCTVNASFSDPGLTSTVTDICENWVTPANAQSTSGLYVNDCPANGCLGFAFTLPSGWTSASYKSKGLPLAENYPNTADWNRPMATADSESCPLPNPNKSGSSKYFGGG